ncbi:hypothetical protein I6I98_13270 [Sphingobacterium multivorum]|uniref:Uncharacterized protein n=1 Tax=Sphingobacterium multivorum TaxID=28454 RepID=A0ABX7CVR3_SPHMU|nr:hypothetical protein [Sphingobacterium multivorum]QQT56171.1 hypothetical protein I6I98_13270 [Sphingobacterium multivorum]
MRHLFNFLVIILLSSCGSAKIIDLGGKAAIKGTEVSQKGLDIYTMLSQQSGIDKRQQDIVKILTHPSPGTMALPNSPINDFSKQLVVRRKAYQSLLNTYNVFALLTDSKYGDRSHEAVSALQESYNSIEKLPDLPTTVSSKLPEVSKMISQSIQAKKIKSHNQILFGLTELYVKLWEADLKTWDNYLDHVYDDYSTGLNTVDINRYDYKKILEISKLPYKDEPTIIMMYRVEQRDEISEKKNTIKKQLDDFGKALKELNKVHAEISKSTADIVDITKMINSIEGLLKEK